MSICLTPGDVSLRLGVAACELCRLANDGRLPVPLNRLTAKDSGGSPTMKSRSYDRVLDVIGPDKLACGEIEDRLGTLGIDHALDDMAWQGLLQWIREGFRYARRKTPD